MNSRTLAGLAVLGSMILSVGSVRADTFVSITPTATAAATVVPRWPIGAQQAGLGYIGGNSGFAGATATNFFSITGAPVPLAGNPTGFTSYLPVGTPSPQASVGNALTPSSYSGLTYVADNLGLIGPLSFYSIHHGLAADYLALIQPSTPTASDQKPMSGPGGPTTPGAAGYFALSYAADNPGGWGAELFYYFRTDTLGNTVFGSLVPALGSGPSDRWNLGVGKGFTDLAYTSADLGFGYGAGQFYYLRLDPTTQMTFFGHLNPLTGVVTDIQNLGGVYRTLTFTPTDVGYGPNNFYSIGQALLAQSVIFAPLAGHTACDAPFSIPSPTASSGLAVALMVSGPATLSAGNLLTLTGATGTVTLTASQSGNAFYSAATSVIQTFAVTPCPVLPAAQTISFGGLSGHTACDAPFTFTAPIATSGLPVNVTIAGPASLSAGSLITLTGATGTVVLTATQTGNAGFSAAPVVTQSFTVSACYVAPLSPQTIAFGAFSNHLSSDAPFSFLYPSATSGLPVALAISGPATLSGGNLVTLTGGVGTVTLVATQTGNATFLSAPAVTQMFTVSAPGVVPVVTSQQDIQPYLLVNPSQFGLGANDVGGTVGQPFTYQITASGAPTSFAALLVPPGLSLNPVTGAITGMPTAANTWFTTVEAINASGTGTALVIIVIAAAGSPPLITSQQDILPNPVGNPGNVGVGANDVAGTVGLPFAYQIVATGSPSSYSATLIPAGLTLNPMTGLISGTPTTANTWFMTVSATNAVGTGTALVIVAIAAPPSSRIVNLSTLANVGPNDPALIMGFVVAGNGKSVLLRGVGPALAAFGLGQFLPDPVLSLTGAGGLAAANAGWQAPSPGQSSGALIAATAAQVGAFALASGSRDSALLATLNGGAYTASLTSQSGGTGSALVEVYDADTVPVARLVNLSVRTNLSSAQAEVISGFVIAGNTSKTLLIRGIGPTLSVFGVPAVLADPQIVVLSGGTALAPTAAWGAGGSQATQLAVMAAQVGAFPLPSGSADAAVLITLQPGTYTVQLSSAHQGAGAVLIELYDTQ